MCMRGAVVENGELLLSLSQFVLSKAWVSLVPTCDLAPVTIL